MRGVMNNFPFCSNVERTGRKLLYKERGYYRTVFSLEAQTNRLEAIAQTPQAKAK